ncbi:Calx-beta domain-containing protein [Thermopirellula anaerolimosa]
MHLPISMWRQTLARLGFKARKNSRRPGYGRTRRLVLEQLETRQLLTTVTVALGQNAAEGSQAGYFVFTRDNTVGSLMVSFSIDQSASTAAYGSDYSSPATFGSVTFAPGSSTVNLSLTPIDDSLVEATESVLLRIQSGSGSGGSYSIGSPSSATCLIYDNDVAATINVSATQDAAEGGPRTVCSRSPGTSPQAA